MKDRSIHNNMYCCAKTNIEMLNALKAQCNMQYFAIFLGKCAHVQECVKFGNLNNTIPHADLSKCSECLKLTDSPSQDSNDQKSESVENGIKGSDLTQTDKEPDGICVCLRCGKVVSIG